MAIHPSAHLDPLAEIHPEAEIGPFVVIEGPAVIARGCRIGAHAQIYGSTEIGENTEVGPGSVLGGNPQDFSFDPKTQSGLIIGPNNHIREHVTMHRSARAGCATRVGANNLFMVGSHLGHDVVVGDHNVLANQVLLGGHVCMGNHVFVGGGAAFHQFVRVGDYSMIQGAGAISMDVPPYLIAAGLNCVAGLNVVGLRRHGFSSEIRQELKTLYRLLYRSNRPLRASLEDAEKGDWSEEGKRFLAFFREHSKKGICLKSLRP